MLLHLLGEEFDEETKRKNYAYYEKRTLHGSSWSPSIYSVMGLHVGDESKAYRYLKRAALAAWIPSLVFFCKSVKSINAARFK